MQTRLIHTLDELAPYADDWDRLAAGIPFRSWTWLSHWWRCYGDNPRYELATLAVFDDRGSLIGLAPWYIEASTLHGRVLRPLGSGEVCSDYLGLLCHWAVEELVIEAVADYLTEDLAGTNPESLHWDLLELGCVDAQDRGLAELVQRLSGAGATVHRRQGPNCWRLELPTDWDFYVASLGKNMRREVRRMERELFESPRVTLHSVANLDELTLAMNLLVNLHQQRRKSLGQEGCFASTQFDAFYRSVVPELLRHGQLQFQWIALDGRPIAAEFQLTGDGVLYAYQAGVSPEAMEVEPGKLINLMILRQAIREGWRAFDFLRGDEPYKARFGAKPRATIEYRVVPRRAMPQLRHGLWLAGKSIKQWAKNSVPAILGEQTESKDR